MKETWHIIGNTLNLWDFIIKYNNFSWGWRSNWKWSSYTMFLESWNVTPTRSLGLSDRRRVSEKRTQKLLMRESSGYIGCYWFFFFFQKGSHGWRQASKAGDSTLLSVSLWLTCPTQVCFHSIKERLVEVMLFLVLRRKKTDKVTQWACAVEPH